MKAAAVDTPCRLPHTHAHTGAHTNASRSRLRCRLQGSVTKRHYFCVRSNKIRKIYARRCVCASACVRVCVRLKGRQRPFTRHSHTESTGHETQDTGQRTQDKGHRTKDTEPAHRRHIHSFDVDATFAVVNGVKMNLCTANTMCAVLVYVRVCV